jgi:hypothetical protein
MVQRAEGPLYTSLGCSPKKMFSHKIRAESPPCQSNFDFEDFQNLFFFSGC